MADAVCHCLLLSFAIHLLFSEYLFSRSCISNRSPCKTCRCDLSAGKGFCEDPDGNYNVQNSFKLSTSNRPSSLLGFRRPAALYKERDLFRVSSCQRKYDNIKLKCPSAALCPRAISLARRHIHIPLLRH
jgi:hypothetical protein